MRETGSRQTRSGEFGVGPKERIQQYCAELRPGGSWWSTGFARIGRILGYGPAVRATGYVAHLMLQHWHRQVRDLRAADRALVRLGLLHRRPVGNGSDVLLRARLVCRGAHLAISRLARNSADGSALSRQTGGIDMAKAGLLWLLGIPIPILLIMWAFGWL